MFKRTLMTVLAVSLLATPAAAQSLGFKLGMTSSTIDSDDDAISFDRLTSLGVGGFLRFGPLQIDVLGMTKGSEVSDPTEGDFDVKLDYIEVPVQFVLGLGSSRLSPYLMIGPSVAFEVGCNTERDGTGGEVEADCDDAAADVFPGRDKMDFGLSGAAGLQIPMGPGAVLLEGRYTHGLSAIFEDNDPATDFKIRNRAFGLFVGYSIGLGR